MTDRATLLSAIKAVEKAKEGTPEINVLIARACFPNFILHDDSNIWMQVPSNMERGYMQVVPMPFYTTSLDAALSLVPEGMCYELDTFPRSKTDTKPIAFVAKPDDIFTAWSSGATMPLAICLAALRARLTILVE